jgi:hypothetical protein
MADWNLPTLTSTYANFLSNMQARDVDAATMATPTIAAPASPPTGYIRFVVASNRFERWNGTGWDIIILSASGGGTGGNTPLKTMAFQDSNLVSITGGSISGLSTLQLNNDLTTNADNTVSLGTGPFRLKYVYIRSGIAIPVGVDKWIP